MFERATDRARKVMALANQEAQRYKHNYLGPEHLLLGLMREGSGIGASVLKQLGVDLVRVRSEMEKLVKAGPAGTVVFGRLPQTKSTELVVKLALEEARILGHSYVGTEHLLLGLLDECESEPDGVVAKMFEVLGLEAGPVREAILGLLGVDLVSEVTSLAVEPLAGDLESLKLLLNLNQVIPSRLVNLAHVLPVLARPLCSQLFRACLLVAKPDGCESGHLLSSRRFANLLNAALQDPALGRFDQQA